MSRRRPSCRPTPERLEDRLVPATVSWLGSAGDNNWTTAANWSAGALPGPTDDVLINVAVVGAITVNAGTNAVNSLDDESAPLSIAGGSLSIANASPGMAASVVQQALTLSGGTLTVAAALTLAGNCTQTGGTLSGSGTVTVLGAATWSGGTMSGSGQTVAQGGLAIVTAASAANSPRLDGRTLANAGAATLSGPTFLEAGNNAVLDNQADATFDIQADAGIETGNLVAGAAALTNQGTLKKSQGSATSRIDAALTSSGSGAVRSLAGTLDFTGALTNFANNTLTGGTWFVHATLQFTNAVIQTNAATVVLDGAGSAVIDQNGNDALAGFAANAAGGSFTIQNGRNFTSSTTVTNAGNVTVGPGSTFTVGANTPTAVGLVSYYPADGNAYDVVGPNNATLKNGAGFAPGIVGQAFNLDGTSNFVQCASPTGLPTAGSARTIEVWFRTPKNLTTSTESALVQYGTAANGQMFGLITSLNAPGKLYFFGYNNDLAGTTTLAANTCWYHGAVTYDGSTVKLYVNGQLEATKSTTGLSMALDANGLTIGYRPDTGAHWTGLIDEVRIYNRALSAAEIAGAYGTGLVSYYPADGNANDAAGPNNLTLNNGAGFAPGIGGQAFNLDGVSSFVQSASPTGLPTGSSARTVELWFQTPRNLTTLTESALVQYGSTAANGQMFGLITSLNAPGKLYFFGWNNDLAGTTTLAANTWYHGAVTYDGSTVKLYVNGQLEATKSTTGLSTALDANGLTIGYRPDTGAHWTGLIDEVRIYNRALSAAEIAASYGSGLYHQTGGTTTVLGTLALPGQKTVALDGGSLTGAGTVNGNVLASAGHVAPGLPVGVLTIGGSYAQSAASVLDIDIAGATAGTQYDQVSTGGAVNLTGSALNVTVPSSYTPTPGTPYDILVNSSGSAITGNFAGLPKGVTLFGGQALFTITYKGGTSGHDVVLTSTALTAIAVSGVAVNGNSAALSGSQRSLVSSLVYTFNHPVTLATGAFTIALHANVTVNGSLHAAGYGTLPALAWATSDNGRTWVVTFSGSGVVNGSIADGVYDLTLHASAVTDRAGQALAVDRVDTFYRLFGDTDGNRKVNNADLAAFSGAFNKRSGQAGYLAYLDYDGSGRVDNGDLAQFANRFNNSFAF